MANLLDINAKITLDDTNYTKGINSATKSGSSFASKIGKATASGIKGLTKITAAATAAAGTAILALGKIGLDYNTQMENYTTNFATMLGSQELAVDKVEELKKVAASTPFAMEDLAGATQTLLAFNISADESSGILKNLGDISLGDSEKLTSLTRSYGQMSSANKVSLEKIQIMIEAGYNPLLNIQEKTGESMDDLYARISAGKVSFSELDDAIVSATSSGGQFEGGMENASKTTTGMMSTLKDNAKALVGEVFSPVSKGLLSNVLPAAVSGISKLTEAFKENGIDGFVAAAGEMLGKLISTLVEKAPKLIETALTLVKAVFKGLKDNLPLIATSAVAIVTTLITGIFGMLPELMQTAIDLIVYLAEALTEYLPELIPAAVGMILTLVQGLVDNLPMLIDTAIDLILAIVTGLIDALPLIMEMAPQIIESLNNGLMDALPKLIDAAIEIITMLVSYLLEPDTLAELIKASLAIIGAITVGLIDSIPELIKAIPKLIDSIADALMDTDWADVGKNIIAGIAEGFSKSGSFVKDKVKDAGKSIKKGFTDFFGIESPSKLMKKDVGKYIPQGIAVGADEEMPKTMKSIKNSIKKNVDTDDLASEFTSPSDSNNNLGDSEITQNIYFTTKEQSPYETQRYQEIASQQLARSMN